MVSPDEKPSDLRAAGRADRGERPRSVRILTPLIVVAIGVVGILAALRWEGRALERSAVATPPAVDGTADTDGDAAEPGVDGGAVFEPITEPITESITESINGAAASSGRAPEEGITSTTRGPVVPVDTPPPTAPPQDADDPSIVARPIPLAAPAQPPPAGPAPPWAASVSTTPGGQVSTAVGCVPSGSPRPGADELDAFFAERVGPVIGWDYQHVYALGGDRYLWLFQDAFIDHSGGATSLGQAGFAHNVALVQEGGCFTLLHGGTPSRPEPFESGTGSRTLSTWFWPMGGEVHDGRLHVFWAQMVKDGYDPSPPDGLGWHPAETWVAIYDPATLARLEFRRAPNPGVSPIYGYAVASDETHTYLFGNTFEQNLAREGGYWSGRHSATRMYLARVPRGQLTAAPEYRTEGGWSRDPAAATPILDRHWAEFPLQPRFIDGQWVGVAAINGYWGDEYSVDVARAPWGPWTTVESRPLAPRGFDPLMNTYHAHLAPWRDASGALVVTLSNNARNMRRDAWPSPDRYRPMVFNSRWVSAPPSAPPVAPPATASPTSVSSTTSTTTTTNAATTTTTTTTSSTTTTSTTTTSTSSTVPAASTAAAPARADADEA